MSAKSDFNKGMAKGLSISEKLFEKNIEVMEVLEEKINSTKEAQDEVREVVNSILDYQNDDAMERLFGLCNRFKPKEMTRSEKEILLNVLLTLAFSEEKYNEFQKAYLGNLKHYLEIEDYVPNSSYDISLLENINDLEVQEIIYKCILEFLFLREENFEFMDECDGLFELFSLRQKVKNRIHCFIDIMYLMFGIEAIIEMYGVHVLIRDENADEQKDENEPGEEEIDINLKYEIIDKPLKIRNGEELVFDRKALCIKERIDCAGKLVIRNCKVFFEGDETNVWMSSGSELVLETSVFKGNEKKCRDSICFRVNGGNVNICKCYIENMNYFLEASETEQFIFEKCEIINCTNLISAHDVAKNSIIKDCVIVHEIPLISSEEQLLFDFYSLNNKFNMQVYNCDFKGNYNCNDSQIYENYRYSYIISGGCILSHCNFSKLLNVVQANHSEENLNIYDCRFYESHHCIMCNTVDYPLSKKNIINNIENCIFENCTDVVDMGDNTYMTSCQFIKCREKLIHGRNRNTVSNCSFIECIYTGDSELYLFRNKGALIVFDNPDSTTNYVQNCYFDGVHANCGYVISAHAHKSAYPHIVEVKDCSFNHSYTEQKQGCLLMLEYTYYGLLDKKKSQEGIKVFNSTGYMTNANTQNNQEYVSDYCLKEMNVKGEKIGNLGQLINVCGKSTYYIKDEEVFI